MKPLGGFFRRRAQLVRLELIEERLEFVLEPAHRHGRLGWARLAQQIHQHGDPASVAVVDPACVDDDAPVRCGGKRGTRVAPYTGDRVRVEPAGKAKLARPFSVDD